MTVPVCEVDPSNAGLWRRRGVRLANLSCEAQGSGYFATFGEVLGPRPDDLTVRAILRDEHGRVIARDEVYVDAAAPESSFEIMSFARVGATAVTLYLAADDESAWEEAAPVRGHEPEDRSPERRDYLVGLSLGVTAESASDAVATFIQCLVMNGLTMWGYRVEQSDDRSLVAYFDGYGLETNPEETNSTSSGDPEYIVRLLLMVSADGPETAVRAFIEHLVEDGFTSWFYRVERAHDGSVIGSFDGFGFERKSDAEVGRQQSEDARSPDERSPALSPLGTSPANHSSEDAAPAVPVTESHVGTDEPPAGDVSHLLEFDPAREAKNGVTFRALQAEVKAFDDGDEPDLHVRGEVVGLVDPLPSTLRLIATVFDEDGRVIGDAARFVIAGRFVDYQLFHLTERIADPAALSRVRLHTERQ